MSSFIAHLDGTEIHLTAHEIPRVGELVVLPSHDGHSVSDVTLSPHVHEVLLVVHPTKSDKPHEPTRGIHLPHVWLAKDPNLALIRMHEMSKQ